MKFKTNINCEGCISKVKPALDNAEGIVKWAVDTTNPAKILTVEVNGITQEEVIKLVKQKGYKIESID
ncbi:MAG: hypothetical protein E6Q58_05250 [Niabella sp.]|nr:MAG: hypothetical protein E6Q58_05250 [Niabella sp.]